MNPDDLANLSREELGNKRTELVRLKDQAEELLIDAGIDNETIRNIMSISQNLGAIDKELNRRAGA